MQDKVNNNGTRAANSGAHTHSDGHAPDANGTTDARAGYPDGPPLSRPAYLLDHHAQSLEAIAPDVQLERGYRTEETPSVLASYGYTDKNGKPPKWVKDCVPALLIPVWNAAGAEFLVQIRPDNPRIKTDGKSVKYETPTGFKMCVDVHPRIKADITNPTVDLWITEGVKKADAAISRGLCCVALLGVWNWRGANDNGGVAALPDWEQFAFKHKDGTPRRVFIAFDSDVSRKPEVAKALRRFVAWLTFRGARALVIYLEDSPDGEKTGLDDYFMRGATIEDLHELAEDADNKNKGANKGDRPKIMPGFPCTDTGNAERLEALFGDKLRFAPGLNWLMWSGTHWEIDDSKRVFELGKIAVRSIYKEAGAAEDEDQRKRLAMHAKSSESASRRAAMIDLASKDCPNIKVNAGDFDAREKSGWLFNCQNGTLDLRTGELFAHDKEENITRLAPVTFDPDATCPTFEQFLFKVFDGDSALIEFVQKLVGYTLTGQTREQCMAILHGGGSNGKSTLLDVLSLLFGPYARPTDAGLLMEKHAGKVSNDLAALRAVRLVLASETKEDRAFDEELVKRITGGDVVTARFLFKEFFDFTPDFKIWLCTNHQPTINGDDDGIWRRIRLIPFDVKFWDVDKGETGLPELQADKLLPEKLKAELPGILNWALEGCLLWQEHGLGLPMAVSQATEAYRASQDPITPFLESQTLKGKGFRVSSSTLYRTFCDWNEGEGEPMSQKAFSKRLANRGFISKKTNNGAYFLGIQLLKTNLGEDGKPVWGDR
jgi:putative DNA primase/helicase